MGVTIADFGCDYRIEIEEGMLEEDGFFRNLLLDYFGLDGGDFESADGVLFCDGGMSDGFWSQGRLPCGYPDALEGIMERCKDGSFVQFANIDDGDWEMFEKHDGEVYWKTTSIECPLELGRGPAKELESMPEGCAPWPRYETGEKVEIGDWADLGEWEAEQVLEVCIGSSTASLTTDRRDGVEITSSLSLRRGLQPHN